jgi:DNA-binding NarL/FixJ family response regulator
MPFRHPDLQALSTALQRLQVALEVVHSRRETEKLLRKADSPADLVISAISLPDGNWCDLLADLGRFGSAAQMVVYASEPDERLWSEVIWRGVRDLLVEPRELGPIRRCLEGHGDPEAATAA